jgi:hypothetical protein
MSFIYYRTGLPAGLIFLSMILSGIACSGDRAVDRNAGIRVDVSDEDLRDIFRVKQVFYALPSPLETAIMLKSAGAGYNEELLNPVENVSKYMTSRSMALNLGIYTTNTCYASLFRQTQTSMLYMDAARSLASRLGIIDAIDESTMKRLEEHLHDQEVIMDIVSETFMNSSSFLQENNRDHLAAIMFVGGWIEGLYLALHLVDEDGREGNELINRIIDSKLSFEIVMLLLNDYMDYSEVADVVTEMDRIAVIFEEIEVTSSRVKVINTPDDPVALLSSESVANIDNETFRQLKSAVTGIRNGFIY